MYITNAIAINATTYYNLKIDPLHIASSVLYLTQHDTTLINSVQLPSGYTDMEVSGDFQKIIAWTELSTLQLVNAATLELLQ